MVLAGLFTLKRQYKASHSVFQSTTRQTKFWNVNTKEKEALEQLLELKTSFFVALECVLQLVSSHV